ncbi:MAG: hypothetical protein QM811_03505 [Pirellulales bacterium]
MVRTDEQRSCAMPETEKKDDPFANPKPRPVDPNFDPFNPPEPTPEEKKFWAILKEIACDRPAYFVGEEDDPMEIRLTFFKADPIQHKGKRTLKLEDLRALPKLRNVTLLGIADEIDVTDDWLPIFAEFKNLKALDVGIELPYDEENLKLLKIDSKGKRPEITSQGIKALVQLPLRWADFGKCVKLDDEAMKTIGGWKKLRRLRLNEIPLTDHGVFALRGCRDLRELEIGGRETRISSASLRTIVDYFPRLEHLTLHHIALSEEDYELLERKLPKCVVSVSDD